MEKSNKVEFRIQVFTFDATDEDVEGFTRPFFSELKDLNIESAELQRGQVALSGSKRDSIKFRTITIAVLPLAMPRVTTFAQAGIRCKQGRTVNLKSKGMEIERSPEYLLQPSTKLEQRDKQQ